jgi:fructosamine-3-kinase
MIPDHIKINIEEHLQTSIVKVIPQSGGDINQASTLTTTSGNNFFLKWNSDPPNSMFESEAKGLRLLSESNKRLIIPKVLLIGDDFLLLSLIQAGIKDQNSDLEFGVQLAKIHKCTTSKFGLDHDNFIGKLPQSNSFHEKWIDFFISERIEPQIKIGIDSSKFSTDVLAQLNQFYLNAENIFPVENPALLHGDLWSGNYMYSTNGLVSIYDPAVYFGHREMDIAMTRLFGGFSTAFYEGYNSEYPIAHGFEERIPLCNLYPLLVHANLFGGGYIERSIDILKHFS